MTYFDVFVGQKLVLKSLLSLSCGGLTFDIYKLCAFALSFYPCNIFI